MKQRLIAITIMMLTGCLDSKCPVSDIHGEAIKQQDCFCPYDATGFIDIQHEVRDVDTDQDVKEITGPKQCESALEPQGILAISTKGHDFADEQGRVVIFHGVNISGMEWGKKDVFTREDLHAIAMAGFNAVRFPIGWTGIEPEKGKIDQEYLDAIRQVVDLAASEGLYVLIDMHQWFWCKVGMPRWTCLEDPKLDPGQEMRESRHFFESASLRDTLAKRWGLVAGLFKGYKNVLGYDLFNEPVPITVDAMLSGKFDREYLKPFYDEMIREIRKQDTQHVIVLEPNVASITGQILMPAFNDPLIAFAPHYYCPHNYEEGQGLIWLIPPSPDLLRTQYQEGAKVQNEWNCPVAVGEFGGPADKEELPEWLDTSITWQEHLGFSSFYWDYRGGWGAFDNKTKKIKDFYKHHLIRSFPVAVAGHDLHFSTRPWSGWLDMSYQVDTTDLCKVTEVYVPAQLFNNDPKFAVQGPVKWRFDKKTRHLLIQAEAPGTVTVTVR